ncbi:MAG: hypothetical protein A2W07_00270 [candidate division Zixibacteria bacterium RBG_16_43_9]|nr:MAG: hypothetical protein A2W07_00270 [candidate division Zixibacteria bacterium RBG_16_43_9]
MTSLCSGGLQTSTVIEYGFLLVVPIRRDDRTFVGGDTNEEQKQKINQSLRVTGGDEAQMGFVVPYGNSSQ